MSVKTVAIEQLEEALELIRGIPDTDFDRTRWMDASELLNGVAGAVDSMAEACALPRRDRREQWADLCEEALGIMGSPDAEEEDDEWGEEEEGDWDWDDDDEEVQYPF